MRTEAATLRLAVFPRSSLLTQAALVVAGTLLVAGAAQISFQPPFTPVPITGQTFAVVLVGASLGAVSGTASLALYLLAGLVLPFYADGRQGVPPPLDQKPVTPAAMTNPMTCSSCTSRRRRSRPHGGRSSGSREHLSSADTIRACRSTSSPSSTPASA